MAICIPSRLEDSDRDVTPGEHKVFNILRQLPDDVIVWYEVVLSELNRRPDFVVLDPRRGVWILEVKDWTKEGIAGISNKQFEVRYKGNIPQAVKNPSLKCQQYLSDVKERLELSDRLTDDRGRVIVPVDYMVVFPKMPPSEFSELKLPEVLDSSRVILRDEITPSKLMSRLYGLLPELPQPLDWHGQVEEVRKAFKQEITGRYEDFIPQSTGILIQPGLREFALDLEQERIAKNLGEGPRLMRGMAGSGKTLIMLMRAKLLASNAQERGEPKRVLVTCWNISLANYMRQAFEKIRVPLENTSDVEIVHFTEWARRILSKSRGLISLPRSDHPDFEEALTRQLESRNVGERDKYDAIYVDEAQDFREEWLRFLFHKALKGDEPKTKNFVAAADGAQAIYRTFSWDSWSGQLGIPMQGRSRVLRRVYRNSARVWMFAGFFLGNIGDYYLEEDKLGNIKANAAIWFAPKPGYDPELLQLSNLDTQLDEVVKTVQEIRSEGYSPRNVLVLYHGKSFNGFPLIDRLINRLWKAQIPYQWITEDSGSKRTFLWDEDSVKISTVHSAKGMDAPVVIILASEAFRNSPNGNSVDDTKLMYVAMTRAREKLKILYTDESGIVPELKRAEAEYQKYRSFVLQVEAQSAKSLSPEQ